LRDALRAAGVPAPRALTRDDDPATLWLSPHLVLGQTCGLPFVRRLTGRVTLLGAPDYRLEGTPPGHYHSAVVVRADDARETLAAFRGATVAVNEDGSQSGNAALLQVIAPLAQQRRFFGARHLTGAHAASVDAVAAGRADIAAIDAVSWRLFTRHRPEAARLRVLLTTPPTPGLPFIAAAGTDARRHRAAIGDAIAGLDPPVRETLGIHGFTAFDAAAYDVIRTRWRQVGEEFATGAPA
jgi:ABC-type phosphate/phosphonate transport system substrate-binding protein